MAGPRIPRVSPIDRSSRDFSPYALPSSTRFVGPSVSRRQLVGRFRLTMDANEESLHVPIEPALPHLVGLDLDERVMAALRTHRHLHRAELTRIDPGSRRRRLSRQIE